MAVPIDESLVCEMDARHNIIRISSDLNDLQPSPVFKALVNVVVNRYATAVPAILLNSTDSVGLWRCMMTVAIIMTSILFRRNLAKPLGIGLITHTLFVNSSYRRSSCEGIIKASASTLHVPENPLLNQKGTPLFREIKSEHIVPALEHDLSELKRDFKGATLFVLCGQQSLFLRCAN